MLPALVGQFVVVLKDTALGTAITYPELLTSAKTLGSAYANTVPAYIVAAILFIIINYAAVAAGGPSSSGCRGGAAPRCRGDRPGAGLENGQGDQPGRRGREPGPRLARTTRARIDEGPTCVRALRVLLPRLDSNQQPSG